MTYDRDNRQYARSKMIAGARVVMAPTKIMGIKSYNVYLEDIEGARFYWQSFNTLKEARTSYRERLEARMTY